MKKLSPIFISSEQCLKYYFLKPITLRDILTEVVGRCFADNLYKNIDDYEVGASFMTGTRIPSSDLDIAVQVKSLKTLEKLLINNNILYKKNNFKKRALDFKDGKIFYHKYILIFLGKFKGVDVQINAEEYPVADQSLIVTTKYISEYYRNNPETRQFVLETKLKGENKALGNIKPDALIFERIMLEDLGYCPNRIERDSQSKNFPVWDSVLDPISWIFLKKKFGVYKAKEIAKQIMHKSKYFDGLHMNSISKNSTNHNMGKEMQNHI